MSILLEDAVVLPAEITIPRSEFTLDYSRVPPEYHASASPDDRILLFKGALEGFEDMGFVSNAIRRGHWDHLWDIKRKIESGYDLRELLDRHTSYYGHTPLLSATFNPECAQVFAPTDRFVRKKHPKTIYEITIPANRCVIDPFDTGECGAAQEIMIFGLIYPDEISAVKILNDDSHSELLRVEGNFCFIPWFRDKLSTNRAVKDLSNWRHLRKAR